MPLETTVYGKPQCYQCKATMNKLDALELPYIYKDLSHPTQAEQLSRFQDAGLISAPVVEVLDTATGRLYRWAGYQPTTIARVLRSTDEPSQ